MNTLPFTRIARLFTACIAFAVMAFIVSCKKDEAPPNIIPSALGVIGTQQWMTRNLSVSTYRDGAVIPQVTDSAEWANLTTGAWCWYNNDSATYAATYGRLYNWYAVAGIYDAASEANPVLRKQLAPSGWHMPSDAEWSTLRNFLSPPIGSDFPNTAGGMMKTTGTIEDATGLWYSPNAGATNSSGFSGNPGGLRYYDDGSFEELGEAGYWWSSTEAGTDLAWSRDLYYYWDMEIRDDSRKGYGFSVRCIKD
jgi:uncharacterized protein (TIGR02145 family)